MNPSARTRHQALPPNLEPLGLSREEAAAYVGMSPTTFDKLIAKGNMPPARKAEGRMIWDREEVYKTFKALSHVRGAWHNQETTGDVWDRPPV